MQAKTTYRFNLDLGKNNFGTSLPTKKALPSEGFSGKIVTGTISIIRYHKNSFLIAVLSNGTSVKGNMISPQIGMEYVFEGKWIKDPKWGWGFKFSEYKVTYPTNLGAVKSYLIENCRWIGHEVSKKLVNRFGEKTLETCKSNPKLITQEIPGITLERAFEISRMLKDNEKTESIRLELKKIFKGTKISRRVISNILELYRHEAVERIKKNPYQLITDIKGIGFLLADQIALGLGIEREGRPRLFAGITHTLKESALSFGHTCLPVEILIEKVEKILSISSNKISDSIREMVKIGRIVKANDLIYLKKTYEEESFIARKLKELVTGKSELECNPCYDGLMEDQVRALTKATENQVFILTGSPGTGKSFLIQQFIQSYPNSKIVLTAPTGIAARKMFEFTGKEAKTIHKVLEPEFIESSNGKNTFEFTRNSMNPIEADIVIIDECFDYKQPILTENGWRSIGLIVNNRESIQVLSRNPNNNLLELKPIINWIKKPAPEKILKISAGRSESKRSARIIRCTENHKILTPYGYRYAGDMCIGEEIIVRGYQFTAEQRSILIGSMLGDGCMEAKNKRVSPQITITSGNDQKEYLKFKHQALGVLAGKIRKGKSGYTDNPVWYFSVNVVDETYEIAKEMIISGRHPSGRKRWTPTNKFLELIDKQALAIWYLDDGSLARQKLASGKENVYATIHSNQFSKEDNQRLADYLYYKFCIAPSVHLSKGYYYLNFNKKETAKLINIILPFIPHCMKYKVSGEAKYKYKPKHQVETTISTVKSIEKVSPSSASVFDIEVSDYHNYIAGNIIVSNCSMIGTSLMASFFEAVPNNTKLIMIGDTHQLPSVNAGNVLRDMIASSVIPTIELTTIKRQDAGLIIKNCHKIKNGKNIDVDNSNSKDFFFLKRNEINCIQKDIIELISKRLPKAYDIDPLKEIQIISPLREKTILSCKALNKLCQEKLNPSPSIDKISFKKGDKVIQTKNNYDLDIVNGDIGFIQSINVKEQTIYVSFENLDNIIQIPLYDNNLQLAYSLTCHKVQGSEFRIVIIPIHKSFGPLIMQRNLVYTAISRAKEICIIVGQFNEISKIINRNQQQKRFTNLENFLKEI
jgi:ATP-dependent exoDNAse (exonuclease V) alpha subunit